MIKLCSIMGRLIILRHTSCFYAFKVGISFKPQGWHVAVIDGGNPLKVNKLLKKASSVLVLGLISMHAHAMDSAHLAIVNPKNMKFDAHIVQPAYDKDMNSMTDILRFVANSANECSPGQTDVDANGNPRRFCFRMLTVQVGTDSTNGTTQCPQEFALMMSTDSHVRYKFGDQVLSGDIVFLYAKDTRQKVSPEEAQFYQDNDYQCGPDQAF